MKKRDEIIVSAIVQRDLPRLDRIAIGIIDTATDSAKYEKWLKELKERQNGEGENK